MRSRVIVLPHISIPPMVISEIKRDSNVQDKIETTDSSCGDWLPYKDDKCFKIIDKVLGYNEASTTCNEQDNTGSLITIRSKEEQDFIEEFLRDNSVTDNIWIGARYSNNKYKWKDNTEVMFTNWDEESPLKKTDRCIQLQTNDHSYGKWSEVLCTKRNLVVCQKTQTWTISQMQKLVMNAINNPFPIGFIYIQLPKEKSPRDIWPQMTWTDISDEYADVFFRVSGNKAATFGERQEESSPRLITIESEYLSEHDEIGDTWGPTNTTNGIWSKWVYTGDYTGNMGNNLVDIRFLVSNEEVRPLNMAIRIWKRTG